MLLQPFLVNAVVPQGSVLGRTILPAFTGDPLSTTFNPVHSLADDPTFCRPLSHRTPYHANARINCDRCVVSVSLDSDFEHVASWGFNDYVAFDFFEILPPIFAKRHSLSANLSVDSFDSGSTNCLSFQFTHFHTMSSLIWKRRSIQFIVQASWIASHWRVCHGNSFHLSSSCMITAEAEYVLMAIFHSNLPRVMMLVRVGPIPLFSF